jgi:hypothetical protein
MLGEELAPLQRSKDIAQSDVARRPRQFETTPDRAERGSILPSSSAKNAGEPRPDWCWRYPPHPPNARPCPDWRPEPSANERQRQIGGSFPSLTCRTARADLAKPLPFTARRKRRRQPTSDRAAAQTSRTLAAARPAAGLEQRAAADEAQAAEPRPAAGERERPAARAQAPGAAGAPAARDEAREVVRPQAPPARALPQEQDEARTGRAPLAQGREAQAAEPQRAAP